MNPLERKIIETIRAKGPVTFEKFMDMALYEPVAGYYASGKPRIGKTGDFYTSSHLHPVFGIMLGRQIEEMWEKMGRPDDFSIVEMGPGEGHLCNDMLNYLRNRDIFSSIVYIIIERSEAMRERQRAVSEGFGDKVKWFSSLGETGGIKGCILSNELIDAFPVHIVRMEDELKEIYVAFDGLNLIERSGPLSTDELSEYFAGVPVSLEKGYQTEVNLRTKEWLDEINASLRKGFVLTIDYGYSARDYYSEDRNRGTLLCYFKHQLNENPLNNIGEQDITAHVNFSSLKKWGEEIQLKSTGYCSQGAFLVSLGIDEEIKRLFSESDDYLSELARIKKLIMPQGMGDSHMVMVQYKGDENPELRGFKVRNQLRYL
jgi:SAM-dependent MidA family methyltransferase